MNKNSMPVRLLGRFMLLLLGWPICPATAQTFTNLHSFVFTNGTGPVAGITLSGTTLYGTTRIYGGGNGGGSGSVFKLNTDGSSFTNLHTFSGGVDGGALSSTLVLAGNKLFGMATFGGTSNYGAVFSLNTDGTGLTNVFNFLAISDNFPGTNTDGAYPIGDLLLAGGSLYGTANEGGAVGWGDVFAVATNGTSVTNLHSFAIADGQYPEAGLILSAGTLYGTTPVGGDNGYGTIYRLSTNGTGYTNFYSFTPTSGPAYTNSDGASPDCKLLLVGDTLYGTTQDGGVTGSGTVFKIDADGSNFTTLHQFSATNSISGTNIDGADPQAGLVFYDGALYGTATWGGNGGNGTVFKLNPDGTGFTTLYNFSATDPVTGTNNDGANPEAGLVVAGGTFYGTASAGGTAGYGTVFSLALPPPLGIVLAGTNVVLSWPSNVTGFNLQSTTNLVPPIVWSPVSGQNVVTNSRSTRQKYYRLVGP
jgi:uncharacterized repeat protein (TIGR03803 family)